MEQLELAHSENPWRRTNEAELTDSQKALNKFRYVMNKLTPQKFQIAMNFIKGLAINKDDDTLRKAIDILFKIAIQVFVPNYSKVYAKACEVLSDLKPQTGESQVTFRSILLEKCDKEFHFDNYKVVNYNQCIKSIVLIDLR